MAGKYKRVTIGSILKSKDATKPDYVKIKTDVTLKKDQTLRLESQKFQLASLEEAVAAGKVKPDTAEVIKERIEKMPTWVRFEIVMLEENKPS